MAPSPPSADPAPRTGGLFRSLRGFNYRAWAIGAFISNIGTWMQRTAQDWLVLTELTHRNASAVGVVMALQFGPQALLLPFTGYAADHFDRRKLVFVTQSALGLFALGLGLLTVTHAAHLWHVYLFAFLLGSAAAFDAPARNAFVSELVAEDDLANAVGLNSTSFNAARMIGPAIAGLLITVIGTGWVFVLNAASYVAVLVAVGLLRQEDLHLDKRAERKPGGMVEGFRYVSRRGDLMAVLVMGFLIGTFGLNFPIFISTMAVTVFHRGAGEFGLLTSIMAVGTVAGALLAARRQRPHIVFLVGSAALFGVGLGIAAAMPSYGLFGAALVIIGISAQTFTTTSNSVLQLSSDPFMRGRVVALFLAVVLGGTPVGAPIVGRVADAFGPRWGLAVGAAAGLLAAFIGLRYVLMHGHLRIERRDGRLHLTLDEDRPAVGQARRPSVRREGPGER